MVFPFFQTMAALAAGGMESVTLISSSERQELLFITSRYTEGNANFCSSLQIIVPGPLRTYFKF